MVAEQGAKQIGAATRTGLDGSAARITEGSIEHYAAHAALGCATGSVSGNCASGATGGVLGEMSALAYKKEHAGSMTQAELRERAGNRAAMIGAVSGAVVGEGGDAVHAGSNAARNAAENNVFRDQIIDKQMELQYLEGQISKEELESYREQKIETIEDIVIAVDKASDFAAPLKAVGKKTLKIGFKKIVTNKDQKLLINTNKNQKLLPAPKTNKQISKAKEDKGSVINTGGVGNRTIKVYRVYGDKSEANGFSWSDINPLEVKDYRDKAGLPDGNTGRFVVEGKAKYTDIILQRAALPLNGKKGGLNELIIDPKSVNIERVSGANPEF